MLGEAKDATPSEGKFSVKDFFTKIKALEENEDVIFELQVTNQFKKSIDLSYRRNFDLQLLLEIVHLITSKNIGR